MKDTLTAIIHKPATFLGRLAGYHDLIELHDKWIKQAWDDEEPVGIKAFRGSFKTSSVVILGVIRHLLLNPKDRIALIRKTQQGDATPTLQAISRILKIPEIWAIFEYLYPGIRLDEDTSTRLRLSTLPPQYKEASIMAYGVYDSITGTHADVILTDDILNIKDRTSSAERARTRASFYELQNIVDHMGTTKQIYNGTCWHEQDVWQDIQKIAKVYDYPASEYWDQLFTPEQLQAKKDSMPATLYAINYELTFVKDDSLPFKDIRFAREGITADTWQTTRVYAQLDCAYGGKDTTALTLLAGDIVRGWVWEKHVNDCMNEINAICQNFSVSRGYIELNADKGLILDRLRIAGATTWSGYQEKMNKVVKIGTILKEHWHRLQFDKKTDLLYTEQISEWIDDTTAHDDAPDSLASLLRETAQGGRVTTLQKMALGL